MKRPLGSSCVALALAMLLALAAAPTGAQIPDEFTNLKLFPKDISKQKLVGTMVNWANGLGVRCNHCHVGPDNLEGMDFATDEKATKRSARKMLEMSRAINGTHLAGLETEEPQVVACYTCHRGQPEPPQRTDWLLGQTALTSGVDAAMAQYKELKDEFYGQGVYEFGPATLGRLARAAFEAGQAPAGVSVLESGVEIYPDAADLHATLGMARMQTGDAEGAAASFDKALEIDPENGSAKRGQMMLEQNKPKEE